MRLTVTLFVRSFVWAAIAISVLAVGLGRLVPKTLPSHHQAAPRYHGVNGHLFLTKDQSPRFLDRETGQFVQAGIPESVEDQLDYAACSPWCDERGQFQMVGRWVNRSGDGSGGLVKDFGLARYTFPEGRALDRIPLDLWPSSEPCWAPGLVPRILFVSGDGQIYHYSFEKTDVMPSDAGGIREPSRPRRLIWRTARPGVGLVDIKDLIWPSDPRLEGRLIASLSYQVLRDGKTTFLGTQLWWLRLSEDQTAIEEAGRLTIPEIDGRDHVSELDERLPKLVSIPEGGLALAYLTQRANQSLWELRIVPVTIHPRDGTPSVRSESSRVLARNCVATSRPMGGGSTACSAPIRGVSASRLIDLQWPVPWR